MSTLADVFREINDLKRAGGIRDYAIGGATAVLFYAEPSRTYDVDVFVLLPAAPSSAVMSLTGVYDWARTRRFEESGEHVMIHGVPVQFLPAHNALSEDAVAEAQTLDYDTVPVRVIGPEHLVALALQAGGARRRERAWQLLESGAVDRRKLRELLRRHAIDIDIGDET